MNSRVLEIYRDKLASHTDMNTNRINIVCDYLLDSIKQEKQEKEQEKFILVRDGIQKLVGHRFKTIEELNDKLFKEFQITVGESSNSHEDSKEYGSDYHLIGSVNPDWGYIDIYWIYDNAKRIMITEVNVSED